MKEKIIALLAVLVVLLSSAAVIADISADENDLTFEVSYEDLDDNDDTLAIDQKITITNNGISAENLAFSLQNLGTDYDLTVSPSTLELAAGSSYELTLSGNIPVNVDQGEAEIGQLKITGAAQGELIYTLKTDVQPMLRVKEIVISVNGEKQKTVDETDATLKNLMPGDEIEMKFLLENRFNDDYDDGPISGEVNVELNDNNFGDDVSESEDFDLDAGADNEGSEVTINFVVPSTAEEDSYQMDITVEGKDDNKAQYTTDWKLNLEVERDDDDVRIEKITLLPEQIACSETAMLTVKVTNYGNDKQNNAALIVTSSELKLNEKYPLILKAGTSDGNSVTKQLPVNVENLAAGKYAITATAYYDFDTYGDKKTVELTIDSCSAAAEEETQPVEPEQGSETVTETAAAEETTAPEETATAVEAISSSSVVKTVEDSYHKEDYVMAGLILMVILLFALIIMLFVALFR